MKKVRMIKDTPIPDDGELDEGEVILGPVSRIERIVRQWIALPAICRRILTNMPRNQEVVSILSNGQSPKRKLERIQAESFIAIAGEVYSSRTFQKLGFKVADCGCSPGVGHKCSTPEP